MRLGILVSLPFCLAIADFAWAGGYTLPAKVIRFQSGMFSDFAEVQIWDSREANVKIAKVLRLRLRYDHLRLFYWYGFTPPFTKTDFARCVELLAKHATKQDVFELGFMGISTAADDDLHVRAFFLDRPKDGQGEDVCYIVDHLI